MIAFRRWVTQVDAMNIPVRVLAVFFSGICHSLQQFMAVTLVFIATFLPLLAICSHS